MKIEVVDVVEHEDGSATVTFDMCEEAKSAMISSGIYHALKAGAEYAKENLAPFPEEEPEDGWETLQMYGANDVSEESEPSDN